MAKPTCKFPDCEIGSWARGYCRYHSNGLNRRGEDGLYSIFDPCTVEGCDRLIQSRPRRMCRSHAQVMAKHGSVNPKVAALRRFETKFDVQPNGCWGWTAAKDPKTGYGNFSDKPTGRRMVNAHRMSWELYRGPIPAGLTIDHLCRNTSCVNPDHLEPVTQRENSRRGAEARAAEGYQRVETVVTVNQAQTLAG